MDPNAALDEIRASYRAFDLVFTDEGRVDIAGRLVDLVQGLDEWLSKGGFLPSAWTHGG